MSATTFGTPPRAPTAWKDQISPVNKLPPRTSYGYAYKKAHGAAKMGADGDTKQRCHVLSGEVANAALERSGEKFTNAELVRLRCSLDDMDNFHTKQKSSNTKVKDHLGQEINPTNDHALDLEIMEKSLSGENLTAAASERAKRQINIFLNTASIW